MTNNKEQYKSLMTSMQGTELQQEKFHQDLTWDEYVAELDKYAEQDQKLHRLIHQKAHEELINDVSLDKLMSLNFTVAKSTIDQMTMVKRIQMLDSVFEYRDYLYEALGRYGVEDIPKEEQTTAAEFKILMGRIKHLEIVQNCLFGIV